MAEPVDNLSQLLGAARAGSPEALGKLLEASRGYLLMVARRELDPNLQAKGGASDLLQETFIDAQRDFAHFQGTTEAELLAWLRRLLLNNLGNFTRRYRATAERQAAAEVRLESETSSLGLAGGLAADVSSPSAHAIAQEQVQAVQKALERLPEDYRQVIILRYQGEHSFDEIGRLMGRSSNAVQKLWTRAIERLQQELEGSG